MLTANGYHDIGMDHFALATDNLYIAKEKGRLHRNFMGFTTQNTGMLIGLGVSAISDLGNAFAQNDKSLHNYYAQVNAGNLAIQRGYFLNGEDVAFRQYIKEIACNGYTFFKAAHTQLLGQYCFPALEQLVADKLVEYDQSMLTVTGNGHLFIRNICSAFDLYLQRNANAPRTQTFSKAI